MLSLEWSDLILDAKLCPPLNKADFRFRPNDPKNVDNIRDLIRRGYALIVSGPFLHPRLRD